MGDHLSQKISSLQGCERGPKRQSLAIIRPIFFDIDLTAITTQMDTELGRNLILWTVRISVAFYAVAAWQFLFLRTESDETRRLADRRYTLLWMASWCFCVIHVLCAYHFEHHWTQIAALKHTAEMTNRVVGINWAGGLYVNYIFLSYWGFDVVRRLLTGSRSSIAMHLVAAFMMFNATVVFGPRWWFLPAGLFLCAIATNLKRHRVA